MKNRIKALREEKRIKQIVLADAIGVSQQTVSKYERNTTTIPVDALINIANYFHTSIDYILCQTKQRYREEYRVEVNRTIETHRKLCLAYERLNSEKKELLLEMLHILEKSDDHVPKEGEHG